MTEEALLKARLSEEEFDFFTMIMDHTQRQIDAVRKQLEEARDEDQKRINKMKEQVRGMIAHNKKVLWAVEMAGEQLDPDVFDVLHEELRPVLECQELDLAYAANELRKAKEDFNNSYLSLKTSR